MVGDIHIIVCQELQPSTLSAVQVLLCEDGLQTLMIREELEGHSIQIMPPNAQSKHDCCKLKIMSGIVLFVNFQLSRRVGDNSAPLHQNTTKANTRCITEHYEILMAVWKAKHWCCGKPLPQSPKAPLAILGPHESLLFPSQSCQWGGQIRETMYEPPIVSGQS